MKDLTHSARRRRAAFVTCAAILLSLIILLLLSEKSNDTSADIDPVYARVFRLHIRANSDSDADQEIKLAVRDALLPYTAELFKACSDASEAIDIARRENTAIKAHINTTLKELGANYTCTLRVGREVFPDRNYGGELYPAGEYDALIVELGDGEGANWWCVLFPSLCLSAVRTEPSVEAGLTSEQLDIIISDGAEDIKARPKYRLKFKFLELLGEFFSET